MRCDDRCTKGLQTPTWVPGWDVPLRKAFMRAITPVKPSTADMTNLIDDFFGQVSRALKEGAFGPEAFTPLVCQLTTHSDRVDTGEGYTRLHNFGVCTGKHFCDFSREFCVLVLAVTGRGVGKGSDGDERAVPRVDAYIVSRFDGDGPEAVHVTG